MGSAAGYGWGSQRFDDTFDARAVDPFDTGTTFICPPSTCGSPTPFRSRVFLPNLEVSLATVNQRGWLAGAFIGAQKQWGSLVLGFEADIDVANVKGAVDTGITAQRTLDSAVISEATLFGSGTCPTCVLQQVARFTGGASNATVTHTSTIDSKIDQIGTLRAKVGFAPSRESMIYGSGGLAWAHSTTTLTAAQTVSGTVVAALPVPIPGNFGTVPFSTASTFSAESGQTLLGWSAGAGIDLKLTPNIILGALYLHYEFPRHTLAFGSGTVAAANLPNTRHSLDAFKGRLSYLIPIR